MRTTRESTDSYGLPYGGMIAASQWSEGFFIDGVDGSDLNDGKSPGAAVKTVTKLMTLLDPGPVSQYIFIVGKYFSYNFFGTGNLIRKKFFFYQNDSKIKFGNIDLSGLQIFGGVLEFGLGCRILGPGIEVRHANDLHIASNAYLEGDIYLESSKWIRFIDLNATGFSCRVYSNITAIAKNIAVNSKINVLLGNRITLIGYETILFATPASNIDLFEKTVLFIETPALYMAGWIEANSIPAAVINFNVSKLFAFNSPTYDNTKFLQLTPSAADGVELNGYIGTIVNGKFITRSGNFAIKNNLQLRRNATALQSTTQTTFSGVTPQTTFQSVVFKAGALNELGKGYRITAKGIFTMSAAGSIDFMVKFGSVVIRNITIPAATVATNQPFVFECAVYTTAAAGAAGVVSGYAELMYSQDSGNEAFLTNGITPINIDLSIDNNITIRYTATAASNACTIVDVNFTEIGGAVL